ncbi:MAG TPA: methyltransferase domain-containing protein [Longimicrobium sp.]|jgi:predicted SAM-dependent methyltransferase
MLRSRINTLGYRLLSRFVPKRFTLYQARELYPLEFLAGMYLAGDGIEIGPLNSPMPLPPGARVRYVDYTTLEDLQRTYPHLKVTPPDVIDNGETLATFSDSSVDFIIASHLLEHTQDPIGTLKNFFRVLRPRGIIFLAIPDKRFTFDVDRPVTPWEHVLRDHVEGPEWSKRSAFEEITRVAFGVTDPATLEQCVERDMREIGQTHFHVWTQTEMLEMLARLKGMIDFEVEAYVSNEQRGEGVIVLRKGEKGKDRVTATASLAFARKVFAERYPGAA